MRITPLDVRKQEFRRSVRGFDCDEVRAFLATLADEYETVLVDNKQLRERLGGIEEKVSEYQTMERTLRDTLMTAERLMQDTRESANKEGDLMIQDARLQAKRILEDCRVRTEELRRELNGLRKEKETYLARFKTLAETQIQFVECHRSDFDDLDRRLIDMVDSAIAGVGAHAATAAAEVLPQTTPTPAPPIPVYQGSESAASLDSAIPTAIAPPAAPPAAPAANEVDHWRDYNPDADAPAAAVPEAAPAVAPAAPVVEIPAATLSAPEPAPENGNNWNRGSWNGPNTEPTSESTSKTTDTAAPATATAADLAVLGIPVPVANQASHGTNGTDGTEEAVATLVETAVEEANAETVPSWGG